MKYTIKVVTLNHILYELAKKESETINCAMKMSKRLFAGFDELKTAFKRENIHQRTFDNKTPDAINFFHIFFAAVWIFDADCIFCTFHFIHIGRRFFFGRFA